MSQKNESPMLQILSTILLGLSASAAFQYFMARHQATGLVLKPMSQTAGFLIVMILLVLLPLKQWIADEITRYAVISLVCLSVTVVLHILTKQQRARQAQ